MVLSYEMFEIFLGFLVNESCCLRLVRLTYEIFVDYLATERHCYDLVVIEWVCLVMFEDAIFVDFSLETASKSFCNIATTVLLEFLISSTASLRRPKNK